ncbi:hypothetical protein Rwratislav_38371 [Rhodococcus wratislaviensis IFP 2016]|nr:hypothetical protein Rwratislav_38371 [Rhodococcus wratislaviensis IFP 2016]
MTHSSHRADEPVSLPTNGDTRVCKFRDAIVCILSDGQQTLTRNTVSCTGISHHVRQSHYCAARTSVSPH